MAPTEEAVDLFIPFSFKGDDSQRIVEGYVSSEAVDFDGQIVDKDWLKSQLPGWMAGYANVREQHRKDSAVGKGVALDLERQPGPHLTAKIVDDAAWRKVKEGVYNGFSIACRYPRIVKDQKAPRGRIVGGDLYEISVVDRPANPAARFTLVKRASMTGWKDEQTGAIIDSTTVTVNPLQRGPQGTAVPWGALQ